MGQLDTESAELGLEVLFDAFAGAFSTQSAFLHTAERRSGAGGVDIVDADDAKLQAFERAHGARKVLRVHVGGQPVACVIGHGQHFIFVVKSDDRRHRASGRAEQPGIGAVQGPRRRVRRLQLWLAVSVSAQDQSHSGLFIDGRGFAGRGSGR